MVIAALLPAACRLGEDPGSNGTDEIDRLVEKYAQVPPPIRYAPGETVRFGRNGNGGMFQTSGWNLPEDGFTWTSGRKSELIVPPEPPMPGGAVLSISAWPLIKPGLLDHQRLVVAVNGVEIGQWLLDQPGIAEHSFDLPAQAVAGFRQIRITFDLPDATSPKQLSIGADERMLGVAFVSFRMDAKQ